VNLLLWVLPPVVAVAALAISVALRGLAEEAERLRHDVGQLQSLRLAVVELRAETERTRATQDRTRLR